MATEKQGQYIASLISKGAEYPTLVTIWKNQDKHRTDKFDGRIIELGKKIEKKLSNAQATVIIKWFRGEKNQFGKNISTKFIFETLTKANLF